MGIIAKELDEYWWKKWWMNIDEKNKYWKTFLERRRKHFEFIDEMAELFTTKDYCPPISIFYNYLNDFHSL